MDRKITNRDIPADPIGARMFDENLNKVGIRATPEERDVYFDIIEASIYSAAKLGKYAYAAIVIATGFICDTPLSTTFGVAALGYGMLAMTSAAFKCGAHQHSNDMVAERLTGTKDAAAKVSFWKMIGSETFDTKSIIRSFKSEPLTDEHGVFKTDRKPF